MSFQYYIAGLFKNFPKDYLIFQDNVCVFDFAVYYLIRAQTLQLHVNLKTSVQQRRQPVGLFAYKI